MKLKLIFNVFLLLLNMVMISMSSATFIITVAVVIDGTNAYNPFNSSDVSTRFQYSVLIVSLTSLLYALEYRQNQKIFC